MDFGELAKYLVIAGAGAFAYKYWEKSQTRVNPDDIQAESKMRRLERMLQESQLEAHQKPRYHISEDDDV